MQKNKDFGTKIKEIRYKYEIFLKILRMQKTKEFGAINYFTPRYTFVKLDLLFSTLKAPGHQIVWFGDPNLTYPNKDYEELSNGV